MKPRIAIHWQILAALVLSTLTAMVLRLLAANAGETGGFILFIDRIMAGCGHVGQLFMSLLKLIVLPLIVTSVVSSIASLHGVRDFGKLGIKTAFYYVTTSLVAILIGLILVNLIEPGLVDGKPNEVIVKAFQETARTADEALVNKVERADGAVDQPIKQMLDSLVPENVVAAAADNHRILGVILFSILFAVALTRIPYGEMQTVQRIFKSANDAMLIITGWIMMLAPVGVYALILPVVYQTGGELFSSLGKYFVTVLLGLALHAFVVLPCVLRFIGRLDPWAHFRMMREALMMAFSTASSSGTLPVTMRCVAATGVSRRVSSFTLPLGSTVNMDGTALYECVAVMFVAQVMGIELGFVAQFAIVFACLLTSIGVAGIPSASLVAILMILKNSHIPNAEMAVVALLAVDRLLDMSRTMVNVLSDTCGAVVIARSEGELLEPLRLPVPEPVAAEQEPESVKPESVKPELVKSEPVKSELVKSELVKLESVPSFVLKPALLDPDEKKHEG